MYKYFFIALFIYTAWGQEKETRTSSFNHSDLPKYIYLENYVLTNDLDIKELEQKKSRQLRLIRNAIFAKYGYIFKSDSLKKYYSKFEWYNPRFTKVDSILTRTDINNIQTIKYLEEIAKQYESINKSTFVDFLQDKTSFKIYDQNGIKTIESKYVEYDYNTIKTENEYKSIILSKKITNKYIVGSEYNKSFMSISAYLFNSKFKKIWNLSGSYIRYEIYDKYLVLLQSGISFDDVSFDVINILNGKELFSCNSDILQLYISKTGTRFLVSLKYTDSPFTYSTIKNLQTIATIQLYDIKNDYLHQYTIHSKKYYDLQLLFEAKSTENKVFNYSQIISKKETSKFLLKYGDKKIEFDTDSRGLKIPDPYFEETLRISRYYN